MIVHLILIILFCHIEIGLVASQTQKDADGRSVHLVAYSNKIIEESCMSMEIAILNGWTYNLLTKVDQRRDSNISDTNNSSPYVVVTPQFNKLFAFHNVLRFLPADDLVLLVDAYDVIIQGNYKKFLKTVYDTKNLFWDHRQSLLYNAEGNCHPFNVINEMYNCPLTQGAEYLATRQGHPIGCQLQIKKALKESFDKPRIENIDNQLLSRNLSESPNSPIIYLNSGVSIGSRHLYKKLFTRAIETVSELQKSKDKCFEDQGIIGWMYAKENFPITLDFNSTLMATSQIRRLRDYSFNNSVGMWQHIATGHSPQIIHFAGSKRAYKIYHKKIAQWHYNRLSNTNFFKKEKRDANIVNNALKSEEMKIMEKFLGNATVTIDGIRTLYYDVCPDSRPFSWKKTINTVVTTVDDALKKIGLRIVNLSLQSNRRENKLYEIIAFLTCWETNLQNLI